MSAETVRVSAGWATTIAIHCGRILHHWVRTPSVLASTIGMPVLMIGMTKIIFEGMVEQFTGRRMDLTGTCVMVAVSMSFANALMGAGAIVQERHEGLTDRLATLPGPSFAGILGRVLAESVRALGCVVTALLVGVVLGADFGSTAAFLTTLGFLSFVALSAGAVGTMLGHVVDTPQGAVSFVPLVMAAMFFNTAMMPREMYAAPLRPIVDASPVTAVTRISRNAIAGMWDAGHLMVFVAWFGGLILLSIAVLGRRNSKRRG